MPTSHGEVTPLSPLSRSAVSFIGRAVNGVLAKTGYRIGRISPSPPLDLRNITADPIEAMYRANGRPFVIEVPLDRCRGLGHLAFRCVPDSGHPLISTIEAFLAGKTTLDFTPLFHFYQHWTPRNAAELLGITNKGASTELLNLPPYGDVPPWGSATLSDFIRSHQALTRRENLSWGLDAGVEDGTITFGPMSYRKAQVEFSRLESVTNSLLQSGNLCGEQGHGYISGYLLLSGTDWAAVIKSGQHRIAALAALGYSTTPIVFGTHSDRWPRLAIRRHDAPFWPNVRNGLFTEDQALEIFDRLIDGKQPPGCPTGALPKFSSRRQSQIPRLSRRHMQQSAPENGFRR